MTRVVHALHHILLLPCDWEIESLVEFGHKQTLANKLPTCLVLAGDSCVYFREDGGGSRSSDIPRASSIASGKLAPAEPFSKSKELAIRRMELILTEEGR